MEKEQGCLWTEFYACRRKYMFYFVKFMAELHLNGSDLSYLLWHVYRSIGKCEPRRLKRNIRTSCMPFAGQIITTGDTIEPQPSYPSMSFQWWSVRKLAVISPIARCWCTNLRHRISRLTTVPRSSMPSGTVSFVKRRCSGPSCTGKIWAIRWPYRIT